jgi:hypothetical protein
MFRKVVQTNPVVSEYAKYIAEVFLSIELKRNKWANLLYYGTDPDKFLIALDAGPVVMVAWSNQYLIQVYFKLFNSINSFINLFTMRGIINNITGNQNDIIICRLF